MIEEAKRIYRQVLSFDRETPRLLAFVRRGLAGTQQGLVVDVGCGYGRTLRSLRNAGLRAIGVDINPNIVAQNVGDGLDCCVPAEFSQKGVLADVMVMSHVIEHFAPRDLLKFVNDYLEFLRPEGYLILATPLLSDRFFDDFDHVKPYQPTGISMVFGGEKAQVQYYGSASLVLEDIWFRRSAYSIAFARGMYIKSWTTPLCQIFNFGSALLFRASAGAIGRTSGWVGLFRKSGVAK